MNKREFDPEKLRVVGRLAWMRDGEEGHWFSVPSSNDQIVFSETGQYVHSLTGVRIQIHVIDWRAGAWPMEHQLSDWTADNGYGEWPRFSDFVEWGEELYQTLVAGGLELWSNDLDAIWQWGKTKTVLVDEERFSVVTRTELQRRLREANTQLREQDRSERRQRKEDAALKGEQWRRANDARAAMRARPEYDAVFTALIGKSQRESSDIPNEIVRYTHALVEYRLGIGRWAKDDAA